MTKKIWLESVSQLLPASRNGVRHQGMTLPLLGLQILLIHQVRVEMMTAFPNDNPQGHGHVVNGGITNGVDIEGEYIRVLESITLEPMLEEHIPRRLIHMNYPPNERRAPVMIDVIVTRGITVVFVRYHIRAEHNQARRVMMG